MTDSNVNDVADFFVTFSREHGDNITNLRLQKYLYYAQGWYLAFYNQPLFSEKLRAWVHGPVHRATYRRFKHNSFQPIQDDLKAPQLPKQVCDHLVEVYSAYSKFSAWDLERMTHAETPWYEARKDIPEDESFEGVIPQKSMKKYFLGRLAVQETC